MEMPGVSRRQVESLGRQNSQLAIQAGDASILRTKAIVNSITAVGTAYDNEIVKPNYEREAISQYAKAEYSRVEAMAETEALLSNPTGMVDAQLIPEGVDYRRYDKDADGNDVRRAQVPAYEVAKDWYKLRLRTTQEAALAEMTNAHAIRKVKNDYNSSFMDNYARVLLNSQKQKLSYDRAELDVSVEKFLEGGNLAKAETLMLGAIQTGTIGVAEGTEQLMAMPGTVDAYRTERAINLATQGELDGIESYIYRDFNIGPDGRIMVDAAGDAEQNPMSFDQRNGLIDKLNAKRKELTAQYNQGRDEASEQFLNQKLITLQETREPLAEYTLRDLALVMRPEDHKTLIIANKALSADVLKGDSDPAILGILQSEINSLAIPREGQPDDQRRTAVLQRINQALDDRQLNAGDSWALIQRVQQSQDRTFDSAEMDLVVDQIYKILTKGSKNSIGLNADPQLVLNAAQAERDLFEAAQAAGPGFDPLGWMDKNFDRYKTKSLLKNIQSGIKSRAATYVVTKEGLFDEPASRAKLEQAVEGDLIGEDAAMEALRLINQAASDQALADEVTRKRLEEKNSSWYDFLPFVGD